MNVGYISTLNVGYIRTLNAASFQILIQNESFKKNKLVRGLFRPSRPLGSQQLARGAARLFKRQRRR